MTKVNYSLIIVVLWICSGKLKWGVSIMEMMLVIFAIFAAFFGMIMVYFNIRKKERRKRKSDLMLNGVLSMRRGKLDKAFVYLKAAYEYSDKINDTQGMADALYHLGFVFEKQNNLSEASELFEEAYLLYEESNDIEGIAKAKDAINSSKKGVM